MRLNYPPFVTTPNLTPSSLPLFLSALPLFCSDYKEYHTDTTVRFVVYLTANKMAEVEQFGYHKKFKLETYLNTSNMVHV